MTKEELQSLLSETRSRGEVKNPGRRVDREPKLRAAMESLARTRGKWFEPDWSKRLVRLLLDREGEARIRTNPIHVTVVSNVPIVEKRFRRAVLRFVTTVTCTFVIAQGSNPGDRAADCGGFCIQLQWSWRSSGCHYSLSV